MTKLYKNTLKVYRRDLPKATRNIKDREWLLQQYPHLNRGSSWNRALYDMNVESLNSIYTTGICLSVAIFIKEQMKSRVDTQILGIFRKYRDLEHFCHAVVKYGDKYYDVFHPEGTNDLNQILYADKCDVLRYPDKNINSFFNRGPVEFLWNNLYSKILSNGST